MNNEERMQGDDGCTATHAYVHVKGRHFCTNSALRVLGRIGEGLRVDGKHVLIHDLIYRQRLKPCKVVEGSVAKP